MTKPNYGLTFNEIDPKRYTLGGIRSLPKFIIRPDRNWMFAVPGFEAQRKQFETSNCTAFAITEQVETYMKGAFNLDLNYSDRALGMFADTRPPGNDPHEVYEALRTKGLVPEWMLPFSDDLKNVGEYYSYKGGNETSIKEEGKNWLDKWDFGHEYVFGENDTDKAEKIWEALLYSPVCVSVDAWKKSGRYYIKNKGDRDNHWTLNVVGGEYRKFWVIKDSYIDDGSPVKYLAWDYDFNVGKRIYIKRNTTEEQISILTKLLSLLRQMLGLIQDTTTPPETPPEQVLTPTKPSVRESIYSRAVRALGTDVSPRDEAPDDLACVESVCEIIKQEGIKTPDTLYTLDFYKWLDKSPLFKSTLVANEGNIIISPTTMGNGSVPNGHVGIFGKSGKIMSNDSPTGLWKQNYTLNGWVKRYRNKGGYPIYFFEAVDK